MPVAVPANISVVLFVQVRMIAAIAIMGGYDVNDDRVKSLVYACMAGNAAKGYLREVGIDVTRKLALSAIRSIPGKTLTAINQKVGFRLLTKFGEKGVVNLGKFVPLAGGYHRGNVRSRVHQRSWQSCQSCLLPRRNPSGSGCAQAGRWAGNRGAVKERWAVRGSSQRSMCVFQHAGGRFSVPVSA